MLPLIIFKQVKKFDTILLLDIMLMNSTCVLLLIVLLSMLNMTSTFSEDKKIDKIKLVWFDYKDKDMENYLNMLLAKRYKTSIAMYHEEKFPPEAYNASRKQYHTNPFLKILAKYKEQNCLILGIVDTDLYVEDLNFVFGVADPYGGIAVIGLSRLKQQFYGLEEDMNLFFLRTGKEAVHEIGHLMDLSHCSDVKCVMHFSNSLRDTDVKSDDFCKSCKIY